MLGSWPQATSVNHFLQEDHLKRNTKKRFHRSGAKKKGWMDLHILLDWVHFIWDKGTGTLLHMASILALGSF